jgi:hypothetical protein
MPANRNFVPGFLATLLALGVGACGLAGVDREAAPLKPSQLEKLDKHLAGKVAGPPVSCIPLTLADNSIRVSDNIILYRVSKRLVYRNDLANRCPGLGRDDDIIVLKTLGSQLCDGDIIQLADRYNGFTKGACSLGKFTPYRAPDE